MSIASRLLDGLTAAIGDLLKPEEINGANRCPTYLFRWTLVDAAALKVYLHKFVGDDWSTDLHDHPKRFVSIGLAGAYVEHTPDGYKVFRAPWFRSFAADHRHRLTGPKPHRPCWTLVVVGRPSREWGFWHAGKFIVWRDYVAKGNPIADAARSCP